MSPQNNSNDVKSNSVRYSQCTTNSDDSKSSKSSNSRLSDESLSSAGEYSIQGSCKDSKTNTNTQKPPSLQFLKEYLPWIGKTSTKALPRHAPKVGGTVALIQCPRPPDLPVKSMTEERSHRKQYQRILEEVKKREKREELLFLQTGREQLKREERLWTDSGVWHVEILPRFKSLRNTKRVKDLWWCGLPSSIRGKVWKLGISNGLNIGANEYDLCLKRVSNNGGNNESLTAIELDVSRTLPNLGVFQEGGPLYGDLRDVLAAYTVYRSDIGYVQGMSFIGAILTLNMEPKDAFSCFANLLENPCHRAAFTLNQEKMNAYYKVFESALERTIPKLFFHFCDFGLSPDLYLLDWLYTIYAKTMPLDVACRVWDVFVRDGYEFLFRAGLGILLMYQWELLRMDFIRCAQFLMKLPDNLEASKLFDNIKQVTINIGVCTFDEMILKLS